MQESVSAVVMSSEAVLNILQVEKAIGACTMKRSATFLVQA